MDDLIPIRKSHITFYNKFKLYYISTSGEPLLYKEADKSLDPEMLDRNQYPQFYINKRDKAEVVRKIGTVLNIDLAKAISSKGIATIKEALCRVVDEALANPSEDGLSAIPETIEILLNGNRKTPGLIEALTAINNQSRYTTEHSVNVLSITAQYCLSRNLPLEQIRTLCQCALLHDVGTVQIDKAILEKKDRLTDMEFIAYKKHTTLGFKNMHRYADFHPSVATTVLEHHERLDGSGYPQGINNISFEAQVVGLIDSYEALKYQNKTFRAGLTPYDALQIIKKDVVAGRYNREVFVDLCSCLIK